MEKNVERGMRMAQGGHVSLSKNHCHLRNSPNLPGWMIILVIIISILVRDNRENIGGKEPLKQEFEVQEYLHDESHYLSQPEKVVEGLQYLHEKTNVQMIVITTSDKYSDSKAEEKYEEMFSGVEGYVLVIVPTSNFLSTYYAIGDDVDKVINHKAMHYLIREINSSNAGYIWKIRLYKFADKLVN